MNIYLQIIFFFFIAITVVVIAVFFREKINLNPSVTRKLFHIIIFTAAAFILTYLGRRALFIFGTIIVLVILTAVFRYGSSSLFKALARPHDQVKARASILIPLTATALGGIFSLLLFGRFAVIGILISGWGDGLAEPIGAKWGKIRYSLFKPAPSDSCRSLLGSFTFMLAGFLAIIVAFWLLQIPFIMNFFPALLIVLTSTLIEAVSPSGTDNFTVQAGASGLAFFLFQNNF